MSPGHRRWAVPWSELGSHLRPGLPRMTETTPERIGSQAVLSTLGMLMSGLVRFGYSWVVATAFGKTVLGHVNSSISLALFVSLLYPAAAGMAATKYVAMARGAGDLPRAGALAAYLTKVSYAAALALGVVAAVLTPVLLALGWWDAVMTGALVVSNSAYLVARNLLYGAGRVRRATTWDFLTSIATLLALGLVAAFDLPWALLVPLSAGYLVYALANLPSRTRDSPPSELRGEMRRFLHISLVNSLATSGTLQLSMVAAQMSDPGEAGSFAAALTLATPASLVARSLSSVLFPSLALATGREDRTSAARHVDLTTRALLLSSVAVFAPLMLAAPLLIRLVYFTRPELGNAALVLPILLAAVMLQNSLIGPTNLLLVTSERTARRLMWFSVAGALVSLVWWLAFAPTGGFVSVAWGYLAGVVVAYGGPLVLVWRSWSMRWTGPIGRFGIAVVVLLGASLWGSSARWSPLTQVMVSLAALIVWLLVSLPDVRLVVQLARRRPPTQTSALEQE